MPWEKRVGVALDEGLHPMPASFLVADAVAAGTYGNQSSQGWNLVQGFLEPVVVLRELGVQGCEFAMRSRPAKVESPHRDHGRNSNQCTREDAVAEPTPGPRRRVGFRSAANRVATAQRRLQDAGRIAV